MGITLCRVPQKITFTDICWDFTKNSGYPEDIFTDIDLLKSNSSGILMLIAFLTSIYTLFCYNTFALFTFAHESYHEMNILICLLTIKSIQIIYGKFELQ